MDNLESKEIKGLSVRTFVQIFISTIITVGSVLGVYYSLKGDIHTIQQQREYDDKYRDLQLQTMQTTISALQAQVENIRNQVNENARKLREER